jgi:Holliday junction resolvase RusA-like endonuclease
VNEAPISGDFFEDVVLDSLLRGASAVQHFFFVGRPVPLARQRSAVIDGKDGKQRVIAFSPKSNVFNKNRIYAACLAAAPVRWPPPYTIAIKFICEPLKTVKEEYPTSPSHGDTDNMTKLILDALFFDKNPKRVIPVFQDDRHIINTVILKRLPRAGEVSGIHFWMIKHG